ncbi:leucine-rich repeat domain-containing protein [Microcoleus sp. N9_B4]
MTRLYLANNQITEIPEVLKQMSNQIKVDLDNNPITPIPKVIELLSD